MLGKIRHSPGRPGPVCCRILSTGVVRIQDGQFDGEIISVEIPRKKGDPVLFQNTDETAVETPYEVLSKMKPAFKKNGVGTAGNASIISDGAAAVVVMSKDKAKALGCTVMATIGAQASYGIDMKYVLVAPIWAIPKCLKKQGITKNQVDIYEINEAFSGSTVAILKELELDPSKVNVNGGKCGHGPSHRGLRLPGTRHPDP